MHQHHTLTIPNDLFFDQLLSFLEEKSEVVFTLRGNSMAPFLRNGDKVVLGNVNTNTLKIGHIVLVRLDGKYILHRIVNIRGEKLLLAGDANIVQTEPINQRDILALAIEAYRNERQLPIYAISTLIAAQIWYYIRPFRRAVAVLSRSLGRKTKR